MSIRNAFHPQSDGGFVITSEQDVEPILEWNKAQQNLHRQPDNSAIGRKIASIPLIVWEIWRKETGGELDRMSKPALAKFVKKKLADPSNQFLRTS